MAEARLIYLDSNLATGGRARVHTCMHRHTHSNTGVLTCSQHYNVRQRLYYYNFIFKFQGKHKEWHSNNYLLMIYEM